MYLIVHVQYIYRHCASTMYMYMYILYIHVHVHVHVHTVHVRVYNMTGTNVYTVTCSYIVL